MQENNLVGSNTRMWLSQVAWQRTGTSPRTYSARETRFFNQKPVTFPILPLPLVETIHAYTEDLVEQRRKRGTKNSKYLSQTSQRHAKTNKRTNQWMLHDEKHSLYFALKHEQLGFEAKPQGTKVGELNSILHFTFSWQQTDRTGILFWQQQPLFSRPSGKQLMIAEKNSRCGGKWQNTARGLATATKSIGFFFS